MFNVLRDDDPHAVNAHKNAFENGRALIVLGGPSGANWQNVRDKVNPDVLIGVNGVGAVIDSLDYWLCAENMSFWHGEIARNKYGMRERAADLMKMLNSARARVRIVNRLNKPLMGDHQNIIWIKRSHIEYEDIPSFRFREYGDGLINGARMQRPDLIKDLRAGTVGLQAIHFACILGCAEIHTIGFDLCLPTSEHHWYKYPSYVADGKFFKGDPFTTYDGLNTTFFWLDTMRYLVAVEPYLELQGITWFDYSGGLLLAAGLRCSTRQVA